MSQNDTQHSEKHSKRIKKVPKEKIVFIDIDEEITQIFHKIKGIPHKDIFIMVPENASLFHSVVNLKILKKKLSDLDKKLSLITKDPVGLKLAAQAEIKAYDQLDAKLKSKPSKKEVAEAPIAAVSNDHDEKEPERRHSKKMSIIDIVKKTRDNATSKFGFGTPLKKIKESISKQAKDTKVTFITPNKRAFSTLLVVSVFLFIFVAYFALPGATITLTTSPSILERSVNVTLADQARNSSLFNQNNRGNIIATYDVETTIESELTYTATGEIFEGNNASGFITVINKSDRNWPLVERTRFQTEEGLVFRIIEDITVPASRQTEKTREDGTTYTDTVPGEVQVRVVADPEDAFGRITGKRGNIGPSTFIIPGLSKTSQNILYAESSEQFTGGTTVSTPEITEEDIEAAKEKLVNLLKSDALAQLKNEVDKDNREKNTNLKLMEDSFVIEFSEPSFVIPSGLVGREEREFTIEGSISVQGIAYNFNEVINILRDDLKLHKSPEKRLVHIYDQSFTYDIVDINSEADQVKITASIKGIEEFDIDPDTENGQRLAKKIKERVTGKSKADAERYIQNLPEVNKVDISTWPAWAPNLPSVPDNIEIEVVQGEPLTFDDEESS